MGTPTYTPLANLTLSASATSVTFSSISQAYRDLVLVVQATSVSGGRNLHLRFNDDATGGIYSYVTMGGNGSTTASASGSGGSLNASLYTTIETAVGFNTVINLMDYSATDKHKTVLGRQNNAATGTGANAGRWASTSAITKIWVSTNGVDWATGTTMALYGIAA